MRTNKSLTCVDLFLSYYYYVYNYTHVNLAIIIQYEYLLILYYKRNLIFGFVILE